MSSSEPVFSSHAPSKQTLWRRLVSPSPVVASAAPPSAFIYGILFIGLFSLYAFTASPFIGFEDKTSFTLSCLYGDIAHAPGYPLYALLCPPLGRLSAVPAVLAAAYFSAACAAAACVLLAHILYRLIGDSVSSIGAAVLFGLSRSFWAQANVPEVYTLNVLLFFAAWCSLLYWREKPTVPRFLLTTFISALALTNHWPLFILAAYAFPLLVWYQRRWLLQQCRRPLFILAVLSVVAVALSPYAYLVWRAHSPVVFYGLPFAPNDWSSFWQIVSRQLVAGVDNQGGAGWYDKRQFAGFLARQVLTKEIGVIGGILLLAGFCRQWRLFGVSLSLFMCFVFIGGSGVLVLLLNFLHDGLTEEIFSVYPLLPYSVGCIWAATAVRGRWRAGVLIGLSLYVLFINFSVNDRRHDRIAADIAAHYLQALPPGGVFVLQPLAKLLTAEQHLNQRRADVEIFIAPNPYAFEIRYPSARLYEPNALSYEEELQLIDAYAASHPVCYNSYIPFSSRRPSQEYLLFSCLREDEDAPYIIHPQTDQFILDLVEVYNTDASWQARQIIGLILQNVVRTLLLLQSRQVLPSEWKSLLEKLSITPTGQLALMEYLVRQPQLFLSERRARRMADLALDNLPLLSRRRQSLLLSALADIYAAVTPRTDETLATARRYHLRATDLVPFADASAVQQALAFYAREELLGDSARLYARYGPAIYEADPYKRLE